MNALLNTVQEPTPKNMEQEPLAGPSKRLKDSYLELAEFESQLLRFQAVANIVAEGSMIESGFD